MDNGESWMEREPGKMKRNGKVYFDVADLPSKSPVSVATLTNVIKAFNLDAAPDELYNKKRNESTDDLKAICHTEYKESVHVYIYGSSINGFGSKSSDIDCIIMSKFNLDHRGSYINPLLKAFRRNSSPFEVKNVIRRGRIPLITVQHKGNGLELDLSFASEKDPRMDVLENSALLNAYALKNMKVAAVGRFLKHVLADVPHFGSAKVGGLSSYSHIIMLIYYLLHGQSKIGHIDVKPPYIQTEEAISTSEGDLFLDFLRFYACEFDSSKYVIDIRYPEVLEITGRKPNDRIFNVEDPIIERNLGKCMAPGRVYELKLFYYNLLSTLLNHKMNQSELHEYTSNVSKMECKSPAPSLHPLCEPGRLTSAEIKAKEEKAMRRKKRQNERKNKKQGQGPSTDAETSNVPDSQATSEAVGGPRKKRNNRKRNKSKPQSNDSEVHATSSLGIEHGLGQNDPFMLEELMKELEIPDNEDRSEMEVSTQKKKPAERLREAQNDTAKLTKALLEQSEKLSIGEDWNVVCYNSTDVIGDSRVLVMIPLLTALGFKVPSIQVGNCASLEKLKCIPGFNPDLTLEQMNRQLSETGCFIGYSKELNIVEGRMAAVLESVGTLKSSSIDLARQMSLSAACGIKFMFCDVKCDGARNKFRQAQQSANNINHLAKELDMKCRVQVTDSTVPYSSMLGYRLELQEVVEVLTGKGPTDMVDVVALQCAHLLQMAQKVETLKEGEDMVKEILSDGICLTKFLDMLSGQGVSAETIASLRDRKYDEVLAPAVNKTTIESRTHGIVRDIKLDALERIVVGKQGGYGGSGEGLQLHADIGTRVTVGSVLVTVHHNTEKVSESLKKEVERAFDIEKVQFNRVIRTFRNDGAGRKRKEQEDTQETPIVPDIEKKDEVNSSSSTESVPKDYVVVVNTTDKGDERTVSSKSTEE